MGSTGSRAFGDWLRDKIGTRSRGQVAEYVGVAPSTVSRWITGQSGLEYRNRLRLAEYLGVDVAEIEALLPPEPGVRELSSRAAGGYVIETPMATVRLVKPRAVTRFLAFLASLEQEGLTEREARSAAADEIDIPERPVAGEGKRHEGGGRARAGGSG